MTVWKKINKVGQNAANPGCLRHPVHLFVWFSKYSFVCMIVFFVFSSLSLFVNYYFAPVDLLVLLVLHIWFVPLGSKETLKKTRLLDLEEWGHVYFHVILSTLSNTLERSKHRVWGSFIIFIRAVSWWKHGNFSLMNQPSM